MTLANAQIIVNGGIDSISDGIDTGIDTISDGIDTGIDTISGGLDTTITISKFKEVCRNQELPFLFLNLAYSAVLIFDYSFQLEMQHHQFSTLW